MKVCENCGIEIYTRDGENLCANCNLSETKKQLGKARRNSNRRACEAELRSYGLTKVRGALGGTYWE